MVYYGIGMSMTVLGGNIFANFALSAAFEIAGYVICILVSDHWGRKPLIVAKYVPRTHIFFRCRISDFF